MDILKTVISDTATETYRRQIIDHGIYQDEIVSNDPDFEGEDIGTTPTIRGSIPLRGNWVEWVHWLNEREQSPANKDATDCSRESARNLLFILEQVLEHKDRAHVDGAICHAIALGRLIEKMEVQRREHHAKRGKIVVAGAETGGKSRAKLNEDDKQQIKVKFNALIKAGHSSNDAATQLAPDYCVCPKTILRSLKGRSK